MSLNSVRDNNSKNLFVHDHNFQKSDVLTNDMYYITGCGKVVILGIMTKFVGVFCYPELVQL